MKKYLTCAETAKLIRTALKEAFPGFKFSVRSSVYSGGASITVSWTDGPTSKQVDEIVKVFEGSYFDGMTDYKGLNYSAINGQEVRFGADFIFTKREYTSGFLTGATVAVMEKYDISPDVKVTITDSSFGAWIADDYKVQIGNYTLAQQIMAEAAATSTIEPKASATAASVTYLGDDGYGYGSTGRLDTVTA